MNSTIPIIGQLFSIAVQAAGTCFMIYLMNDMKYSFYFALVNKFRYMYYKSRVKFFLCFLGALSVLHILTLYCEYNTLNVIISMAMVLIGFWGLLTFIHNSKHRVVSEKELESYNEPFLWIKTHPVYTWYLVKALSTIGIVFGLLHQLALDQIYTKPKEFFISGPLSGLSFMFILIHLIELIRKLKAENRLLRSGHKISK